MSILLTKPFVKDDKLGNYLIMNVHYDELEKPIGATLRLKLKAEGRERTLGHIYFADRSFHCKRKTAKHFHFVTKSFGFNWEIINDDFLCIKNIHLVVDNAEKFVFPASAIKDYGKFLNFKQQGFELQKFLQMDIIRNYKVPDFNPESDGAKDDEDDDDYKPKNIY